LGSLCSVLSAGPLPGTTRVAHLVANIAAANLAISATDFDHLDAVVAAA